MSRRYEYLFEILDLLQTGRTRLWTGEVELELVENTWKPTNLVESVSISGGQWADAETRVTIGLIAATDEIREAFMLDPGPAQVTLRQVVSTDDGVTWALVPRAFTGRVTGPELQGDRYRVDLVDRRGDPLRPRPRFWSDEDQHRRFPGDTGLQYMRQIAAGVDVKWP